MINHEVGDFIIRKDFLHDLNISNQVSHDVVADKTVASGDFLNPLEDLLHIKLDEVEVKNEELAVAFYRNFSQELLLTRHQHRVDELVVVDLGVGIDERLE